MTSAEDQRRSKDNSASIAGNQGSSAVREPGSTERKVFVARQPIFDNRLEVFGYELLFRSGRDNFSSFDDGDQATRLTVSNALNIMGLNDLVAGKKAFVNITRELLLQEFHTVMPRSQAVIELLENVEPDAEVIKACEAVRADGYLLALDDFVFAPKFEPLLAIADIVKVDFRISGAEERRDVVQRFKRPGLSFLAEKVEGPEEFEEAVSIGYKYFQGYFFAKPKIVEGHDISGVQHKYMMLLQKVYSPEVNFDEVQNLIKSDSSLSVKLLKYLNSAGLGLREKISTIKQALVLLGEKPLRKWASLVAMTLIGELKPPELGRLSLARAEFCELLCNDLAMSGRELDMFMLGLLSAFDAMLDCPLEEVLAHIPLAADVKETLLGGSGKLGKVYMMVQACERGDWKTACMLGRLLGVSDDRVNEVYVQSLRWADEFMRI